MAEKDFVVKKGLVVSEGITLGGHAFDDIDIGSEFTDTDDHIMSSGAIKEKIEAYNYLASVDISANTNLAVSSPITLSGDTVGLDDPANLSELNESTDATDDKVLLWDESASAWKYMTLDNLQDAVDTTGGGGIASLAADTSPQLGGNLDVDGNSIVSTSDGPIDINPNGTGKVRINTTSTDSLKLDVRGNSNETVANFRISTTSTTSNAYAALQLISGTTGTSGTGQGARLQFRTGGDGYAGYTAGAIYSSRVDDSNHHLHIAPQGTGNVSLGNFTFDADQSVGSGQDNYVLTYDHSNTHISLEAASGGGGASVLGDLTDVSMDITNFVDGILIQPNSDGSAPTTGTLNGATENIGIGKNVFQDLTSADYNVVIGPDAGMNITTGGYNVLVGRETGQYLTTTTNTVAIGDNAGRFNTGGSNTFVGTNAGKRGTSGATSNNTIIGLSAGGNNTGGNNTIIGHQALTFGAGGADNVVIGYLAGQDITSDDNVAIGASAALNVTSGTRNIAIGAYSMDAATTDSDNIAIGYDALGGAVSGGEKNIAIGNYSSDALTSGDKNTVIGHEASSANATGELNTVVGYQAHYQITGTSNNTMIGARAGRGQSGEAGGHDNTAVGHNSFYQWTTGAQNIIMGSQAGYKIRSGTGNVVIGYQSHSQNWADGNYNTALGYQAQLNMNGGANNISIGKSAGDNITTGDNNLVIGAADVDTADGDDQISISSGDGGVTWLKGDVNGIKALKIKVKTVTGAHTLTDAQSGSYVYCTGSGVPTLPASAELGQQYTIINNTGGNLSVGVNSNTMIPSSHSAMSNQTARTYVAVASSTWFHVG